MGERTVDWSQAKRALRKEVERVARLLRSVTNPAAPALGEWSVDEVAMHLSQAWMMVPGLARKDLSAIHEVLPGLIGTAGASMVGDVWELGEVMQMGVRHDPERELSRLADLIEERAREYFTDLSLSAAHDSRAWLVEGSQVAVGTLICHLLNETVLHGWDIARGDGQRWQINPAHAVLILEGFLVPVIQALDPRALVNQEQARGLRATYELRVRGGGHHVFVFEDGALTVEAPSSRPIDCFISADPVAFLLVAWGRQNQATAIVKRQLVVSGPQAWLGLRFRSLLRNP